MGGKGKTVLIEELTAEGAHRLSNIFEKHVRHSFLGNHQK